VVVDRLLMKKKVFNFKLHLGRQFKYLNYVNQRIRRIFHLIDNYVNFDNSKIKHKFEKETNRNFS